MDSAEAESSVDISSLDEGLLWNSYMIDPLLKFRSRLTDHEREGLDHSRLLTSVIRGFVKSLTIPPSSSPIRGTTSGPPTTLTVISRLSSRRAGRTDTSRIFTEHTTFDPGFPSTHETSSNPNAPYVALVPVAQ